MRYFFVILALTFTQLRALAFEPHFIIREFEEAYAHLTINLLYQDQNCMIWLGTSEGVMQYTGTQFTMLPFPDTAGTHSVTALNQDAAGILWVGTESGQIWHYDYNSVLTPWSVSEERPGVRITDFCADTRGQMWIATYGEGLYVSSNDNLTHINTKDGLLEEDIYTICLDGRGRIWAATDQGINICTFEGTADITSVTEADGLPDQIIRCLTPDQNGNIWIGAYEGSIAFYDIREERIRLTYTNETLGRINDVALFNGIELWIATQNNGIWRYFIKSGTVGYISGSEELQDTEVRDLLKDVEGNLWVVARTNTILTTHRPFQTMDLPVGFIQALLSVSEEQLWIGSDQGLFLAAENGLQGWSYRKIENTLFTSVASLDIDLFGNIWIGSLDAGLFVYDTRRERFMDFEAYPDFQSNPIISFFIRGDRIWLATLGRGIIEARIAGDILQNGSLEEVTVVKDNGASHNFIFQVKHKMGDEIWLATDGAGLAYTDSNAIHTLSAVPEQPKTIYSITEDAHGNLWMVTPDNGLVEYNHRTFSSIGIADGLRTTALSSVTASHKDELIIVHNKGIDLLIPDQRHFMYFDDEIGLKGIQPVLNAVHRDDQRNVWIGMENKIVKYTSLYEELSIHPRTWIAHIAVNQEPIDMHGVSTFPAGKNFFTFDYVGLWYTSPQSVKYLYTLEGHDLDWKESADHLAIYSNLKPGKYTFKVRASENRFFYDEPLAEYSFEIRKPFWQTVWFLACVLVVTGGLFYLFMKNREARLKRIEALNKEKIESQLRALKAQINPHFLFNSFNTLITIIDENTDNPEIPIEYVEKLADFYRSILLYREEEEIPMPEEIQMVQNYYYLLQKRYGENLILDIRIDGVEGLLPPLVLQMLVENAVKHNVISKSKPLTIRIYTENNSRLIVENNIQKKVASDTSTRFGLQNIVKRYEFITDKEVVIEETEAYFRVSLPIIQRGE